MAPREPPPSPTRSGSTGGNPDSSIDVQPFTGKINTDIHDLQTKNVGGGNGTVMNTTPPGSKNFTNDTLSKLPQAQVREMREAFQILDRDSDGQVNRDDVVDTLASLGM